MEENKLYKIIAITLALAIVFTIITSNVVSITGITLLKSGGTAMVDTNQKPQEDAPPAGDANSNGDNSGNNNGDNTEDTTAGSVDANANTGSDKTTQGSGTGATTAKPQGSTQKSNADIAKLYNDAINKTKAYKGNVKIKRVEGVTTTVTEFGFSPLKGVAEKALPNTYPETREGTFKNGAATAEKRTKKNGDVKEYDPGAKLSNFLPPPEGKSAKLSAAGIKDAKYTAVGGGYKLEITLIQETGNSINFVPPHHSSVMDTLAISDDELGDFRVLDATSTYAGAKIVASVNAQGVLTSLSILELVNVTGKVGHKSTGNLGISAVLDGNWKQDITFTY